MDELLHDIVDTAVAAVAGIDRTHFTSHNSSPKDESPVFYGFVG